MNNGTSTPIVIPKIIKKEPEVVYLTKIPKRDIKIFLSDGNPNSQAVSLTGAKLHVKGDKYIGIQQDVFTITTFNIHPADIFKWISSDGKTFVIVEVDGKFLFTGSLINVTSGSPDIRNYEIVMDCLSKTTVFLTNLVRPFRLPSSMNVYNIIRTMLNDGIEIPEELKDIYLDDDTYISGNAKSDLDAIILAVNSKLEEQGNTGWLEILYDDDRVQILSSKTKVKETYQVDGASGLLNIPSASENGLSFRHIFRKELVPGAVVKIDNALISTLGNNSAFIYVIDPGNNYVITHVNYELSNYEGATAVMEVECYPYSKFNNWSVK